MPNTISILILCFFSSFALAAPHDEKIKELMGAKGIFKTWEELLVADMQRNGVIAQSTMDQKLNGLDLNGTLKERAVNVKAKFLSSLSTAWSADEIFNLWARYYGSTFSNEEIDQLIAFYKSPLGIKEVQAHNDAYLHIQEYCRILIMPKVEAALEQYGKDLDSIVSECKCSQ